MEKAFVETVKNQIETANSFGSSCFDLDHIFCQKIGMFQSDWLNISHKKPSQSDISYFLLNLGSMFCQISPSQSHFLIFQAGSIRTSGECGVFGGSGERRTGLFGVLVPILAQFWGRKFRLSRPTPNF